MAFSLGGATSAFIGKAGQTIGKGLAALTKSPAIQGAFAPQQKSSTGLSWVDKLQDAENAKRQQALSGSRGETVDATQGGYVQKQLAASGGLGPSQMPSPFGSGGGGGGGSSSGLGNIQNQLAEKQRYDIESQREAALRGAAEPGASSLSNLISAYNKAYGQALTGRESKYGQIFDILGKDTGQREADIKRSYGEQRAGEAQRLGRLGMANTTVLPTQLQGISREEQGALNRLTDQLATQKTGILERKEDIFPSTDIISALAGSMVQNPYAASGAYRGLGGLRLN